MTKSLLSIHLAANHKRGNPKQKKISQMIEKTCANANQFSIDLIPGKPCRFFFIPFNCSRQILFGSFDMFYFLLSQVLSCFFFLFKLLCNLQSPQRYSSSWMFFFSCFVHVYRIEIRIILDWKRVSVNLGLLLLIFLFYFFFVVAETIQTHLVHYYTIIIFFNRW